MKLSKLLLAIVGATVLLGALVSSASARNLSTSSQTTVVLFRVLSFSGGLGGPVECEVKLSGSLHVRTITKTLESLIGYITEGTILRCSRGSATIRQETLPWHRRYAGFVGTLPSITQTRETVVGAGWNIVEPGGFACTVSNATSTGSNEITGGAVTRTAVSGTSRCGTLFTGTLSGSETNVNNGAGARITVTLI